MGRASDCQLASKACGVVLVATIASGPGAMLLVELTHPQPRWQDAQTFARNLHGVQALPYFLGLFLIGGFCLLLSCLHALARAEQRARTGAALVFCAIAGALVFLNYVLQTTFVPQLARSDARANDLLIRAFSMSNPTSLAWALEMWGYGFLGVATWLAALVFARPGLERVVARIWVANGFTSIAGALAMALAPGWVMTPAGFVAFGAWNALVVVMLLLTLRVLRAWRRDATTY